jgi:hypothetical protein
MTASPTFQIGYLVWCCHDFREPEGTVWFDHEPMIGEKIKLCDGKEWTITKIRQETFELDVKLFS